MDRTEYREKMSPTVSSFWVLIVLVARKGANAATLFILARMLGVSDFGAYSFVISVVTVLSVFSLFGLERLSARELAKYLALNDYPTARGFLLWSLKVVATASILVTVVSVPAVIIFGDYLNIGIKDALKVGLFIIPVLAFLSLSRGILRGLHRPVLSHVPESLFRPSILLVIVAALYVLDIDWNAQIAVLVFMTATVLAMFFALIVTKINMPAGIWNALAKHEHRTWTRSAIIFSIISLFTVLNTEALIIILGLITSTSETGAFKLASNFSGLISFVLIAINVPLGPIIARQIARGEKTELQETVTKLARMGFLLAVPMVLGCWVFGRWLLGLFGSGFVEAFPVLAILASVQLLLVAMGSVASVLVNAGYESLATRSITIGTVLNLGGALLLIPLFGSMGAAVSFAAGSVSANALMMYYAAKQTGLDTSVLGLRVSHGRRVD